MTDQAAESEGQKFELYIKASAIDKETKGSCPICQQFFMMTCLLGENQDDVDFKVFTVQHDNPPKNFLAGWSKKYPVIMVNSGRNKNGQDISNMMYDTFEDLESFFESINKECPELKRKNAPNISAMSVVENLYKHFNHFIAGQPEKGLLSELKKLNEYLESQDTKFLVDNVLSFSDCHLLPRLQHIRVAAKTYRDFEIPKEFTYIWRYLKNAYEQDAFKSTMPSDQDIVFHYQKKAGGPLQVKGAKPTLQKFTYALSIPEDVLSELGNGTSPPEEEQVSKEEEPVQAPEPVPEPVAEPEPEPQQQQVEEQQQQQVEEQQQQHVEEQQQQHVEEQQQQHVEEQQQQQVEEQQQQTVQSTESLPDPSADPESAPDATDSAPDGTDSAPDATDSAPNATESAPDATDSAPDTTQQQQQTGDKDPDVTTTPCGTLQENGETNGPAVTTGE